MLKIPNAVLKTINFKPSGNAGVSNTESST